MRKIIASAVFYLALIGGVFAQSLPPWPITTYGYVATPAQWGQAFTNKQDYLGAAPCIVTGCVMTGEISSAASTAISSGFNIAPGVAPTTPINGDIWTTTAGLYVRINGVTIGPLISQNFTGSLTVTGALISSGAVPTGTSGSCVASSFVGGATAGKFTAPTCAAGTIILTNMPATTTGYSCILQDQTTIADTLKQTSSTTTSATFTATTASGDSITYDCRGW